jgi:predicted phosphodiesterase
MRLAMLADIHGNIQALQACLQHARAQQVQRLAFLGDLVGYGAHPAAVVERVMQLSEQGASVVRGNHDAMAVHPPKTITTVGENTAHWTHAQLSAAQRNWLDALPYIVRQGPLLLVHASVNEPQAWHYIYDEHSASASMRAATQWPEIHYIFSGHVHEQSLYFRSANADLMKFSPQAAVSIAVAPQRQWLGTVGSVGQPRDGKPDAMYAIFDTDRWTITYHRVAYDHCAAANDIRRAGLPEFFALRLAKGR